MKYQALILAALMVIGTSAIAQDTNTTPKRPSASEVQRGPQFRGGERGEAMRKEMQDCKQCQKHRKHMQEKHLKGKGLMGPPDGRGPGPRGQGQGQRRGPGGPPQR